MEIHRAVTNLHVECENTVLACVPTLWADDIGCAKREKEWLSF